MDSPISLNRDLENYPFRHSQPMEADECIRDVVRSTETYNTIILHNRTYCVLHRLESTDKVR